MDLTTAYLGFKLKNPLIASSSPLTLDLDNIRRLEDCGAAAVVLPSIFEEQIEAEAMEIERLTTAPSESFAEALSYFPAAIGNWSEPRHYLDIIRRAREAVAIPVIASLNGISPAGWRDYARMVEQAGASAIELNAYFIPSDLRLSGSQVEDAYLDTLKAVKAATSIPVALKLSPYFSALGDVIRALDAAGADGFTLFNRFYQPDIDLAQLRLQPEISLSHPAQIRLPLLWIGVLAGNVHAALAASTGVDTVDEVIKFLLVGADAVMTTSSLLRHGIEHMTTLVAGLERWLEARNIKSLDRIRGKMRRGAIPESHRFRSSQLHQDTIHLRFASISGSGSDLNSAHRARSAEREVVLAASGRPLVLDMLVERGAMVPRKRSAPPGSASPSTAWSKQARPATATAARDRLGPLAAESRRAIAEVLRADDVRGAQQHRHMDERVRSWHVSSITLWTVGTYLKVR